VNVPFENAMVNFGKTKKVLGLESQETILRLQIMMDTRFEELYKKEVEKIKAIGEEEKAPTLVNSQCNWCLPSHII